MQKKNANYILLAVILIAGVCIYLITNKINRDHYLASKMVYKHPVLEYQQIVSEGQIPATLGDPIRSITGSTIGPVPVPRGALKMSSEKYKYPFYYQQVPLAPYNYFKPYGPNQQSMQSGLNLSDTPFYNRGFSLPALGPSVDIPFISSVNSFAPFPEVESSWEKTGILTTVNQDDDSILNVYRRPIAPLQDLFIYMVQDKDGFLIKLKDGLLEDGNIVVVPGKESKGSWEYKDYSLNKYIWM